MKQTEFPHVLAAIIILTIVIGFTFPLNLTLDNIAQSFLISAIIVVISIFARKIVAYSLDADAEHETWRWQRFGYKPHHYLKEGLPAGIVFPLFFSIFSLGLLKIMAVLTYNSAPLRYRATRRFGYYSYGELTEFHNGLIGAAGILSILILSIVSYLTGFEMLAKFAAYYAFWNMIPISSLDGSQIFFGSRVLWTTLAIITLIFTVYAFDLPI